MYDVLEEKVAAKQPRLLACHEVSFRGFVESLIGKTTGLAAAFRDAAVFGEQPDAGLAPRVQSIVKTAGTIGASFWEIAGHWNFGQSPQFGTSN